MNSTKYSRIINTNPSQTLSKTKSSFHDVNITLLLKADKNILRKEYYRPIISYKHRNPPSSKPDPEAHKRDLQRELVGLIPEIAAWFSVLYILMNDKSHMIILICKEKAFDKNPAFFDDL